MKNKLSRIKQFTAAHPAACLWTGLTAIVAFHGLNNHFILNFDKNLLDPDHTFFISYTRGLIDLLLHPRPGDSSLVDYLVGGTKRPPLFYVTAAPLVWLKTDIRMAVMANLAYLGLSMACIYGIGRILFSRGTGILAAVLFSFIPTVFAHARTFYMETALTAMVALTVYLFLLNRFDRLPFALFTGLVIGAGALIKQPYLFYLPPALALYFMRAENRADIVRLRNFLITLGVGGGIIALWYVPNHQFSIDNMVYFASTCVSNPDPWYYVNGVFHHQLGPVFSILLLTGSVVLTLRGKALMPVLVVLYLALFSLANNKMGRFILPLFPFMALIIAAGNPFSRRRNIFAATLTTIAVIQFFFISFCADTFFPIPWQLRRYFPRDFYNNAGIYSLHHSEENWRDPIAEAAAAPVKPADGRPLNVLVISRAAYQVSYELTTRSIAHIMVGSNVDFDFSPEYDRDPAISSARWYNEADALIMDGRTTSSVMEIQLRKDFERYRGRFTFVRKCALPDGDSMYVYQKTK